MGTLYVVGTPIGNMEDITQRALRVLKEVPLVAAEDTRKTRRLLAAHGIATPLTSYHEVNKREKLSSLVDRIREGDLALVSEAGMPGLSDPGYELISASIEAGARVVPIPGPSAAVSALVVSGLPVHQFTYLGFLPRMRGERRKVLQAVAGEPRTMVLFEAPHRVRACLEDLDGVLGNRRVAVCREMTKIYEEIFRGTVREAIEHFERPRGEFTIVIEGCEGTPRAIKERDLESEVSAMLRGGSRLKDAVAAVAASSGVSKRILYDRCKNIRTTGQEKAKCVADACQ